MRPSVKVFMRQSPYRTVDLYDEKSGNQKRFGLARKFSNYSQHFMQIETSELTYILLDAPFNGEGINV